jgi:cytochrome b subunit of formate dehydrogenase
MGVESEVEAMDNAQERLCHWLHVLCIVNIR